MMEIFETAIDSMFDFGARELKAAELFRSP